MKEVSHITLHWSESSDINRRFKAVNGNIEKDITLNAFTIACKAASVSAPKQGEGYDKTKFTVHLKDGDTVTMRLDITDQVFNPKLDIQELIRMKTKALTDALKEFNKSIA